MKLALLLFAATSLSAESTVGFTFNLQANSLFCSEGSESTCKPKEDRLAGVMVLAKSSSDAVIGYRITVVATLADGATFKKTILVDRWPTEFTGGLVWIAKELTDFTNPQITVEGLYKKAEDSVTGQTPGLEY